MKEALLAVLLSLAASAFAQSFPAKPVRMIHKAKAHTALLFAPSACFVLCPSPW